MSGRPRVLFVSRRVRAPLPGSERRKWDAVREQLEFRMLAAFVRNANQVLSHEQLLELAWGDARNVERDQVKLYVGYLRRKLAAPTGEEPPIETVRGFGYRYRPPALA